MPLLKQIFKMHTCTVTLFFSLNLNYKLKAMLYILLTYTSMSNRVVAKIK